jgi:hypothetical protein
MKLFAVVIFAISGVVVIGHAADAVPVVSVLESNLLWVCANHVSENFAGQLHAAQPTNSLAGTILDLRGADGDSAAPAADYFSTAKSPLVILVNRQTDGAAVTLANKLRAAGVGIVIGSPDGNIRPDIAVSVRADDETRFLKNPYAASVPAPAPLLSATNDLLPYVDHTSEAELVRKRIKDGEDDSDASNTPRAEPVQPVIRDPVLARAVDLLKALAILHPARG